MSSRFFIKQSKIVSKLILTSAICATSLVLSSCSNGTNTTAAPRSALTIKAPSQYPILGTASTIPVVVTNNSGELLSDLQYTIANSTYGSNQTSIQIDTVSSKACARLAAHQSCQLSVHIPANTQAGAFSIKALNANANPMVNKLKLELNELASTNYKTEDVATTWVGLTSVAPNLTVGADGLTLYFPTSVSDITQLESANNSVVITAVVGESAGVFNTVALVDNSGNPLNYTTLTGNSGRGLTSLATGSVVSMVLNIPNGVNQIQFKIQTSLVAIDGTVDNLSTASVLHSVAVLEQNNGMIQISPSYFKLTDESDTQLVIVANNDAYPIQGLAVKSTGSNVLISNGSPQCRKTLSAGDYCEYSVTFNKNTLAAGMEAVLLSYIDNQTMNVETQTSTASYVGANNVGGLSINSSVGFNFSNFTNSTESSLITYTNTGTAVINNLQVIGLPSSFVLSAATSNPCSTAPISLNVGQSCNMVLTYINNKVTSSTTTPVTMSYNFMTERGYTFYGSSSYALSYQTIQSSAVLTASVIGAPLTTIVNNGVVTQTASLQITNNGNDTASNFLPRITGDVNNVFRLVGGGTCTTSLTAGESCTQIVQFGPTTTTNVGTQNMTLNVDYTPYAGATTLTSSLAISGQLATAQSAIIAPSVVATGFAGGTGTSTTPYQVQQNNTRPTLTYTFTNTGTVPATNFQIAGESSISSIWSVQDNCAGKTLDALNGSCSIVLSLNTSSVGSSNLDLTPMSLSWIDQDSPFGQTQAFALGLTSTTAYANVFAPPSIVVASNLGNVTSLTQGNQFKIAITLTGGYNVPNQVVSFSLGATDPGNFISINPNPCIVSSNSASCVAAVSVSYTAGIESNVKVSLFNSGAVSMNATSYTFSIRAPKWSSSTGYVSLISPCTLGQTVGMNSDSQGNLYVSGYAACSGLVKGFVAKYSNGTWSLVGNTLLSQYSNIVGVNKVLVTSTGDVYFPALNSGSPTLAVMMKYTASSGTWAPLGNTIAGTYDGFTSVLMDSSGNLYANGSIVNGSLSAVWKYNPSTQTWNILGPATGIPGAMYRARGFAIDAMGNIYVAGHNNNAPVGGAVWKYNGSTWSVLGTFPSGTTTVYDLAIDESGNVYAASGNGNTGGYGAMYKYSGGLWSQIGANVTAAGFFLSMKYFSSNNIYATGNSLTVWHYDGTVWSQVSGGAVPSTVVYPLNQVIAIAFDALRNLYVVAGQDSGIAQFWTYQ